MEKPVEGKPKEKSTRHLQLARKSEQELKELLEKQENLLQNKQIINSLPDKGQKITQYVEDIKNALRAANTIDDVADRMTEMQLDHGNVSRQIENSVIRDLQQFVNNPDKSKIIVDERKHLPNSYEMIMKRNSLLQSDPKSFRPNRIRKDQTLKATVETNEAIDLENISKSVAVTSEESDDAAKMQIDSHLRLKHRYDESLEEMRNDHLRYPKGVQMIQIEESIVLLHKNQQAIRDAEIKRAEAMLASKVGTKVSDDKSQWHGKDFVKYRDDADEEHLDEDDDSDEENKICDYGDDSDDNHD